MQIKNGFGLFVSPLQQALEHNSFLFSEKKIEQGDVEHAFKYVDQIIEGKYRSLEPENRNF